MYILPQTACNLVPLSARQRNAIWLVDSGPHLHAYWDRNEYKASVTENPGNKVDFDMHTHPTDTILLKTFKGTLRVLPLITIQMHP